MIARIVLVGIAIIALSGCGVPPHQPLNLVTPVPTETPSAIHLPADDVPHDDLTEWWYYTGHLTATNGDKYGFEFVIFQVKRQGIPVFYAAHSAITDHQRQQFVYDQRTWTTDQSPSSFRLGSGDWQLAGDGSSDQLSASVKGYQFALQLRSTKPPAFHGNDGVISFGPVGDSYYYSDTRLMVSGSIVDGGVSQSVTGEAWKDRQWGNFIVTPGGGWDWISAQLDDGSDLMLFLLRDSSELTSPAYGTWVDPTGHSKPIDSATTRVTPAGTWRSPQTEIVYPSGWLVELSGQMLKVNLNPVLKDQELDTRQSTGQIYWEGEVTIDGQLGNNAIGGKGYVELTGYSTR